MSDTQRRAIRTLLQGLPPAALLALAKAFHAPIDEYQTAALMVALTAISSALFNLLEDKTGAALGPSREG